MASGRAVARGTRLIVGCCMMREHNWRAIQEFADRLPLAQRYCSDQLAVYQELLWPKGSGYLGEHVISLRKEETYTIESLNADLRTYLGRLKRISRCFSRCWKTLAHWQERYVCSLGTTTIGAELSYATQSTVMACRFVFSDSPGAIRSNPPKMANGDVRTPSSDTSVYKAVREASIKCDLLRLAS